MQKLQYPKIIRESLLWKNAQTQETFFISCKQTFKTLNTVSTLQYNLNTGEIHFSTCITPIIFLIQIHLVYISMENIPWL